MQPSRKLAAVEVSLLRLVDDVVDRQLAKEQYAVRQIQEAGNALRTYVDLGQTQPVRAHLPGTGPLAA